MKYRQFILILGLTLLVFPGVAQWRSGHLLDDGTLDIRTIQSPESKWAYHTRASADVRLREGYPIIFAADPAFKNFRNVSLADLDGNGTDEIIFGVADKFFVYRSDTLWWSHQLSGLARFPAAIGDLEKDGIEDIVILTGFNEDPGQVYAFNARGIEKPGWPRNFDDRWMISSPALADLNGDGQLEIICSDLESGFGSVYILKSDGSIYNNDWPVTLPNVPAVTPSVGDLDLDGLPEIIIASTREIYAFDLSGNVKDGWPFNNGLTKFSFQSPILGDLDGDGSLETVMEGHGDLPLYLTLDAKGHHRQGWPKQVPQGQWTFHTPTVIPYQGEPLILTGRPISDQTAKPMLFAWRPDGSLLNGFPLTKSGGLEGLITVADIDRDQEPEIIFPSNMIDSTGHGFIHAYELDGSGEVPGFPLRPYGWTYLNGATLGDVDGNGLLDMAVLTYTENEGSSRDSALLYVYEIDASANPENILWSTYKGSNLRNGLTELPLKTSTSVQSKHPITLYPNPVWDYLYIETDQQIKSLDIFTNLGTKTLSTHIRSPDESVDVRLLPPGVYYVQIKFEKGLTQVKKIIKTKF